jgi:hypothetical protein
LSVTKSSGSLHVFRGELGEFSEMPPIFKNIEVSRDHMKTYAEERNIMNQPRKCLVGSMFGENIMIISPLLKWYVKHGIRVTKIYKVVEYMGR